MANELQALGEQPHLEDGGVSWTGDARSVMRANLWLRTASRVIVRVATFEAKEFYELERRAKKIAWGDYLAAGVRPEFRVTARKSKLYHSDAIAERLLNSVAARARDRTVRRPAPDAGVEAPSQLFVVRVAHDQFTISADTSGDLLHMRGYREEAGKAPVRETLAAALLMASGWNADVPLLDPFCGSGTIAIEGALIARRIPPGLHREFSFMRWPNHDATVWKSLLTASSAGVLASSPVFISGSDRDSGAIKASQANAVRAGVPEIEFTVLPISSVRPAGGKGLIATNPPYGKRVSQGKDVRNLYAKFGKVAREWFSGWKVAVLSPEQRLSKQLGLPLRETLHSVNGGIRVSALLGTVGD